MENIFEFLHHTIYVVAAYFLVRIIYFTCKLVYLYVLPSFGFAVDLRKYGEWAVVTGATDGIGKEYALQLAQKGFKIVLISRSEEKLSKVANEIHSQHNVETKTIVYNFKVISEFETIRNELSDLDIGILVNNVGTSTGKKLHQEDCNLNTTFDVMHVNMFSNVALTNIVLKNMVKQQRGLMIHISSLTVEMVAECFNVYSATKVFLHKFVNCLRCENPGIIDQQIVIPGFVETNLSKQSASFTTPTAQAYVRSALGTAGRVDETYGCWMHDLVKIVLSLTPSFIISAFFSYVTKNQVKKK